MPEIKVQLKERSYPIIIGSNITDRLLLAFKKHVSNNRLFVFYDAGFYALHGTTLNKKLNRKFKITSLVIARGEKVKSTTELNKIYSFLLNEKISRSDFILACGGGVTSDLIGYIAATTLRGIKWGIISTTLVGMVDAAIGGKTGINHKEGKNLIGAFWQPTLVGCDTRYLKTLPPREMIAGLGEVVKYCGLIGKRMSDLLYDYLSKSNFYDEKILVKLIALSVKYKADIVSNDVRERGIRMLLNLGHTFGHAIEKALGYGKLLHGEAIILGLYAACQLSKLQSSRNRKAIDSYQEIIEKFFPFIPYRAIDRQKIIKAMSIDKKRRGEKLKFILLDKPGKPIIVDGLDNRLVHKSITSMLNCYRSFKGKR